MKRRIVAMFLGGMLAAGSLAMQTPVTAWAITLAECGFRSEPHINSSTITTADGTVTVTVDLECENQSSSGADIFLFEKELNRDTLNDINPASGMTNVYTELKEELEKEGKNWQIDDESHLQWILMDGSCTFAGLPNGKTYYLYAEVADWHNYEEEEALHSAVYLGSVTVGDSASVTVPDSASVTVPDSVTVPVDTSLTTTTTANTSTKTSASRNYVRGTAEELASQIKAASAGDTIVMGKEVTTLSNADMKALLRKSDVSVKLEFTYKDKGYVIEVPSADAVDNDIPWYGPLYLAQQYGNSANTAN